MQRGRMCLSAALCLAMSAPHALAVKPEEWKHEQPKDFLAGKLENVVVSSLGEVMLGREVRTLQKIGDDVEVVNALAAAGDGKVYAATGPNGRIYQVDGDKVTEFAKLPDGGNILSLLFAGDGTLLAGTGGDKARIHRIDGSGKASIFYEPPDAKYVWSMVRGSGGEIYAATGVEGRVYRIEPNGKTGKVLVDMKPKNVLCLAIGQNGMLYAGTDEEGLISRINPADGKLFVLYDAKEAEISSLVVDEEGNLYAATAAAESARPGRTVADKPGGTPDASETKPSHGETMKSSSEAAAANATTRPATQPAGRNMGKSVSRSTPGGEAGNVIYRIDTNGFVTEVFREPVIILAMVEASGTIYAATGNEGRIYSIVPSDERVTMLAKLEPAQGTSILRTSNNELIIGTANAPSIVRVADHYAAKGTLLSKAFDASQQVKWGRIAADAEIPSGAKLTIATRSSNVEDEESPAWEDWSSELELNARRQIPSTSARFLQYRITLETNDPKKTPLLRSLTIPRIEENRAPVLSSIELVSAREEAQKPTASSSVKAIVGAAFGGAAQAGPQDYWVVKWKAEDPNKDTMEFEVYYRKVGDTRWIQMAKEVKEQLKIWDTRTVEDGRYEIRVVAKDSPSNPSGTDATSARLSDLLIVDNTPPDVSIDRVDTKGAKSVVVHVTMTDASTNIGEAAYSVDSDEEWTPLAPGDDIFDSMNETTTFTISDLEAGEHRIAVRVRDERGNTRYVGRTVTTGQ